MDSNRDHAFSAIIRQSARTAGVYRTRDVERIAAGRQPPELTAQVLRAGRKIGRASCRERVEVWEGAVSFRKKDRVWIHKHQKDGSNRVSELEAGLIANGLV